MPCISTSKRTFYQIENVIAFSDFHPLSPALLHQCSLFSPIYALEEHIGTYLCAHISIIKERQNVT